MQRREFIALIGGATAAWPLAARAQQSDRMVRIGVLMALAEDDPVAQAQLTGLKKELQMRGWTEGRNVRIDFQWGLGDADWVRTAAAQLLRMGPDVMKIEGLPVTEVDEGEQITVAVTVDDLLESDIADPERHPIAIALRRQDDVDDARVTKNETLVRRGNKWFRYDAPDKRLFKQLQKTLTAD